MRWQDDQFGALPFNELHYLVTRIAEQDVDLDVFVLVVFQPFT